MPDASAAPRMLRRSPLLRLPLPMPPRRPRIPRLPRLIPPVQAERLPPTEQRPPPATDQQPPAPRPAMARLPVIPMEEQREGASPPAIRTAPLQLPLPREAIPAQPPVILMERLPPRRMPARGARPRPAIRIHPARVERKAGPPAQEQPHTARPPIRGPLLRVVMRFEPRMAVPSAPAPMEPAATCTMNGAAWTFITV